MWQYNVADIYCAHCDILAKFPVGTIVKKLKGGLKYTIVANMKKDRTKSQTADYFTETLQTEVDSLRTENDILKDNILLLEEKVELVKKDRDKYRKMAGYLK